MTPNGANTASALVIILYSAIKAAIMEKNKLPVSERDTVKLSKALCCHLTVLRYKRGVLGAMFFKFNTHKKINLTIFVS